MAKSGVKSKHKIHGEAIKFQHLVTRNWSMATSHFHENFELNLAVSGGNRFFVNDRDYAVAPGDLYFFSNMDLHRNRVEKGQRYERYLITFDKGLLAGISTPEVNLLKIFADSEERMGHHLSLDDSEFLALRRLLDDTIFQIKTDYEENPVFQRMKLVEVLLFVRQCYNKRLLEGNGMPAHQKFRGAASGKLKPVIDYINHHLDGDLRLEVLSRRFYMNRSYLCKLFKEETGFTVNQYITSQRVLRAKSLLMKGMSVTQVTAAVGYGNDAHFIRTFKKLVGETPKQYGLRYGAGVKCSGLH